MHQARQYLEKYFSSKVPEPTNTIAPKPIVARALLKIVFEIINIVDLEENPIQLSFQKEISVKRLKHQIKENIIKKRRQRLCP